MLHRVKLFAVARDLAGSGEWEVKLPTDATVAGLRMALGQQIPALAPLLSHMQIAIDSHYAADDEPIAPGAELAVIPPVSGG